MHPGAAEVILAVECEEDNRILRLCCLSVDQDVDCMRLVLANRRFFIGCAIWWLSASTSHSREMELDSGASKLRRVSVQHA